MKKLLIIALCIISCISFTDLKAQKANKLGHLNSEALFDMMPEKDSIAKVLQDYFDSLQKQLTTMQTELQSKATDYQQNEASMSDIIKETKQREITDLQTRISDFQQLAQKKLSDKQTEVTKPVIDRIKSAVTVVAKENGYTYIFNYNPDDVQTLLFAEPNDDIMPLVKKKLGLN